MRLSGSIELPPGAGSAAAGRGVAVGSARLSAPSSSAGGEYSTNTIVSHTPCATCRLFSYAGQSTSFSASVNLGGRTSPLPDVSGTVAAISARNDRRVPATVVQLRCGRAPYALAAWPPHPPSAPALSASSPCAPPTPGRGLRRSLPCPRHR
eukprot:3239002-Prymnesium_polylepis.3